MLATVDLYWLIHLFCFYSLTCPFQHSLIHPKSSLPLARTHRCKTLRAKFKAFQQEIWVMHI